MTLDPRRMYELLPAIHRVRDAAEGGPLEALIRVLAEQAAVVEEDLEQLYDDQFIETCARWVAPYIGDLIGYRTLYGVSAATGSPRAEVANTIAYRRRKGTASVLEQLARDVTGWNARVVEFFQLLATTQYMNHVRPFNHYAPNLRNWETLERLDTPFDTVAHTVDVGRISSGEGLYNIPNIGIFLWRLGAYSLTRSPAVMVDATRFLFSPLGNDSPLFTRPVSEAEITHLAEPLNVPDPISRRVLDAYKESYYGPDLSLELHVDGVAVPAADIHSCNLEDAGGGAWAHEPVVGVAVDPELGRIAFPAGQAPDTVEVTYHYGFSADSSGGEYERAETLAALLTPVEHVASPAAIQDALDNLTAGGAVEIDDSGRYEEMLAIDVDPAARLELRAANAHRPTAVLNGELTIRGGADAEVTLNGLLLSGAALRVPAAGNGLRRLVLRHCTLVPGFTLDIDGEPAAPGQPSLIVEQDDVTVVLEHCIVGAIRAVPGASFEMDDCIVDAHEPTAVAFADLDGTAAGAELRVVDSTIVGKVHTRCLELASNVIFLAALAEPDTWTAAVRAEQKQKGCVRFSWVPSPARESTPT